MSSVLGSGSDEEDDTSVDDALLGDDLMRSDKSGVDMPPVLRKAWMTGGEDAGTGRRGGASTSDVGTADRTPKRSGSTTPSVSAGGLAPLEETEVEILCGVGAAHLFDGRQSSPTRSESDVLSSWEGKGAREQMRAAHRRQIEEKAWLQSYGRPSLHCQLTPTIPDVSHAPQEKNDGSSVDVSGTDVLVTDSGTSPARDGDVEGRQLGLGSRRRPLKRAGDSWEEEEKGNSVWRSAVHRLFDELSP